MDNVWDEVRQKIEQAKAVNTACDNNATSMAELIVNRLKHVKGWRGTDALRALKKELRDFNMVTGRWN